jgi:Bacterial regulatory helix-turn-helix protein, lysR family
MPVASSRARSLPTCRSRKQPALSRQIKDLEDELRIRLFDRIRRRLVLTGEGEQLLGHCRGILGAVGSLAEQTELLRGPDAGRFESGGHAANHAGITGTNHRDREFNRQEALCPAPQSLD